MKFHFMKYRKLSYWVSGILVALSIVSVFISGFAIVVGMRLARLCRWCWTLF